ncbi:hypothetical protein K1719_011140 [Acacia pycnantha]|nr:hypothetical protein K1719_045895 [Acacia pycnantha]KAI9117725.1 hypothetical protein K1719_011140 [Acacia pycnantha]
MNPVSGTDSIGEIIGMRNYNWKQSKAGKMNVYPESKVIKVGSFILKPAVHDDGAVALLPCAINAACAVLVDAGIPLKHLAVAICCSVADSGYVLLDPNKLEEEKMKAFAYLVFPNACVLVLPGGPLQVDKEPMEHGIITSETHGAMSVDDYLHCLDRGRAASAKMSEFLRRSLQPQLSADSSKAG